MFHKRRGAKMGKKFDSYSYINQYQKENYERITILMPKEKGQALKEFCKSKDVKVSAFINQCIDEKMKRLKVDL